MSVSTDLAAFLDDQLDVPAIAAVSTLANLAGPIVYVTGARIEPRPFPFREYTLDAWALTPEVDAVAADATLDPLVELVLAAIDAHPIATWTSAERTVYGDAEFHAYRIAVSTITQREP